MNKTVNDVVVVLIGIFGKTLNYRGDSLPKFLYMFSRLLRLPNFKWA